MCRTRGLDDALSGLVGVFADYRDREAFVAALPLFCASPIGATWQNFRTDESPGEAEALVSLVGQTRRATYGRF